MLRKLVLFVLMALPVIGIVTPPQEAPFPQCYPCCPSGDPNCD